MASTRLRVIPYVVWSCGLLLPQLTAAQADHPSPALRGGSQPGARAPSQLSLRQAPCPQAPYDTQALSQLLEVELRGLGVTTLQSEPPDSEVSTAELAVVQLGCGSAPATLSVEVADLVSGNRVVRELVVTDVEPAARARMLSIAIASLLESSWASLAAKPPASAPGLPANVRAALLRRLSLVSAQPSAASAEPVELPPVLQPHAPDEPSHPLQFSITLSGRSFPSRNTGLIGLELAMLPRIASNVCTAIDVSVAYGRQQVQDTGAAVGEVGLLWLGAGAGLYWASQTQPELLVGPLLRLAYLHSLTSVDDPDATVTDGDGIAIEMGVGAWMRAALGAGWDGYLGCEIGYVPGAVTFVANDARVISVGDVTMVLRAGFGW